MRQLSMLIVEGLTGADNSSTVSLLYICGGGFKGGDGILAV